MTSLLVMTQPSGGRAYVPTTWKLFDDLLWRDCHLLTGLPSLEEADYACEVSRQSPSASAQAFQGLVHIF
jgi:hypothetical protein